MFFHLPPFYNFQPTTLPFIMIVLMELLVFHPFFTLLFLFKACSDNLQWPVRPYTQWICHLTQLCSTHSCDQLGDFTSYFTEEIEGRLSHVLQNQQSYHIFSGPFVYKYLPDLSSLIHTDKIQSAFEHSLSFLTTIP